MQITFRSLIELASRFFIAAIFLASAFGKITNFNGTVGYMAQAGVPMPAVLLPFAIIFILAGGLSLISGYRTAIGSALIIIFMVIVTPIFHNPTGGDQQQAIQFLKNVAIIGGLLGVIANGAGPLSLDSYFRKKSLTHTQEKGVS